MPSTLVTALAAPIHEVQSLVGPGWSSDPAGDPAAALGRVRDALADVSAAARRAWNDTDAHWSGTAADAAAEFAAATVAAADALAMRASQLGRAADTAAAAVESASGRLRAIAEGFEARAAALEPYLESPGVAEKLMAEARRSLVDAVAVVDELRAELDGHASTLATPTAQPSPAATSPAGLGSPAMPTMGSGLGGGAPISPLSGTGGMLGSSLGDLAKFSAPEAPLPDAAAFGDGFAIRLPDDSTAMAPNAVAASAVRHALTQLGVPYQWGGTAPAPGAPAPTTPAGYSGAAMPTAGSGGGSPGLPFSAPSGLASASGLESTAGMGHSAGSGFGHLATLAGKLPEAAVPAVDPGVFGDGVAVQLPDGSTATAPNPVAASAVRHALTQLGVPYQWGGTTPGLGLDCSGLTQWAYHEAGLNIPRLAQEQDIGTAVDAGSLRPGDLAVWDGHVAMIVGNGTMIEAGDPVHLSPIRTANAGQGFQGFWRPTA